MREVCEGVLTEESPDLTPGPTEMMLFLVGLVGTQADPHLLHRHLPVGVEGLGRGCGWCRPSCVLG